MSDPVKFVLPEGRLVGGDPFNAQTKDHLGNPKQNPTFFIAVAVPKTEPAAQQAVQTVYQVATRDFPNNQVVAAGPFPGHGFAWKLEDGDDPKHAGKEGYANCYIFKFTRGASIGPIPVVNQAHQTVMNPMDCQRGYYVMVAGSTSGNGQVGNTAGMYLNVDMMKVTRPGEVIHVGPSPDQLFGAPTAAPGMGGVPGMPQAPMGAAPAPGNVPAPQAMPQAGVPGGMPGSGVPSPSNTGMPAQTGASHFDPNAQTPPAGTPGAPVTTGVPQGVPGAVPGAPNPAAPQQPTDSQTASPFDLQQQGVTPQPGFLMPGATGGQQ